MEFKYDSYGLYTNILGDKEGTLRRTCLYYILAFINKELLDAEVVAKYPIRKRREDETFEEYDDYLTKHLLACEEYITKSGTTVQNLDVLFNDKIKILQDWNNNLKSHPLLFLAGKEELQYAHVACQLYDFPKIVNSPISNLKLFINTLTFLLYYAKIDTHNIKDEDLLIQFILSKKIGDSWWSRTARKLYFSFRPMNNGYKFNSSDTCKAAIAWKYRDVSFDGREASGFKHLWEPVIDWLKKD